MKAIINKFISTHWDHYRPLLLALSGGPDSRLLLELLCELQEELKFPLAIAHVDHRWRQSSEEEARELQLLAESRNLTFHLKILNPTSLKGNLEAACRTERLSFFRQLCLLYDYQAVFLAHHADDRNETVLKKLFEGASLSNLNALHPITVIDELTIWRPLLSIRKDKLVEELQRRSIRPFEDETNQDPRFLRGRLRTSILPFLNETFGKNIHSHLQTLSDESQELQDYLNNQISAQLSKAIEGPFGWLLDLSDGTKITNGQLPISIFELKYLIKSFCMKAQLPISKQALQEAAHFLTQGAAGKSLSCGQGMLYIDRYCLFAVPKKVCIKNVPINLTPGEHIFGPWQVIVENQSETSNFDNALPQQDWRSAWQGTSKVNLEYSDLPYTLSIAQSGCHYQQKSSLRKWWNNAKVPFFMRSLLPVIMENHLVKHEFLSGKQQQVLTDKLPTVNIILNWKKQET